MLDATLVHILRRSFGQVKIGVPVHNTLLENQYLNRVEHERDLLSSDRMCVALLQC
jgi:hypothetical protein